MERRGRIDECLRRAAGEAFEPSFSGLADKRLRLFEKAADAAGCRATAQLWENTNFKDAESHFHAARYRAVTAAVLAAGKSPDAASQSAVEADRSMAWLKKAVAAGYKDAAHMKQDRDLDALRSRTDFQKLLAADADVRKYLTEGEIAANFDLGYHLKEVDTIFARVFGSSQGP